MLGYFTRIFSTNRPTTLFVDGDEDALHGGAGACKEGLRVDTEERSAPEMIEGWRVYREWYGVVSDRSESRLWL